MSESEDDAPSAVSFQQSKIDHENFDNQVRDFLKDRRSTLKEKRKAKEEAFKSQREEKIKRDAEKEEAPSVDKTEMTAQQRYQHQKRFLPAGVVSSLKDDDVSPQKIKIMAEDRIAGDSSDEEEDSGLSVRVKPKRMKRKIYEKFNIRVEALGQLENKRTASALDFRNRRLGKVHRESVDKNRIHQEKLIASGQIVISK